MSTLAQRLLEACRNEQYVPKWNGIRTAYPDPSTAPVWFTIQAPTRSQYKAWVGSTAETDEQGKTADQRYLETVVVGGFADGRAITRDEAVALLQDIAPLGLEVGMAAFALQAGSVQAAPNVSDLVKGAEVLEKEGKGKGLRDLAHRLHLALGGNDTEGNG